MIPERLRALLAEVAAGAVSVDDAERRLAWSPVEELDFASVDHHRALRQGFPEVVFGQGKTPGQVVAIAERIAERGDGFLATRVAQETADALAAALPGIELNPLGRTAWLAPAVPVERKTRGSILIVTAGTSDLPVAEEAAVTAAAYGNPVERLTDVGVAGIHRLLQRTDVLRSAAVVVVIAGMEGALPSVVGGLVSVPVIAVPTSVGYGASFGGIAALLGMLNSCASGVTVVNIDNGFGAAAAASRINLLPQP
ncbi:MAG TPA: nickel pincer cofactor biosynthesis protein LarB [Longimicrobium sp.]|nr:nickel pincer cofactor biosynthesis protein LarB [Longimicrobium sp.]